ncbi:glutamine synthetase [Skermania sp. ID1734]|uniref:glutamine synthetase family protein n=1 Tax=Skermania sp. ID1734 TaxID=2597516 RepID=UPI00117E8DE2|nr:glutamine synthetase family protein [Skermania sp. ID1734]TSE00797.1 glutamine synthetase [Skermania sp. ID1734]
MNFDDPQPGLSADQAARAEQLTKELADLGCHGIVLSWVDNIGVNRVKTIPIQRLSTVAAWGVGMSPCFDTFLADDSTTMSPLLGGPDGDLRLIPDLDSVTALAAQPGWAWAPVDRLAQDGVPHVACSRSILRRVLRDAAAVGESYLAALEIEFALGLAGDSDDFVPACHGPAYSMTRLIEQSEFGADLLDCLAQQGIPVEQLHPEYSTSQYELSVGALDPLGAADRSVLARQTIRAVARRHGLRVSFAPVVVAGTVGNGGHAHISCWRDGKNLHAGGSGRYGMSAAAESFVAGLLRELPALTAISTPSPISYLRMQPSQWAGAYTCWGRETREAAVRVITGMTGSQAHAANVEFKCADLTANPYLLLAGIVAAGRAGIADSLPLGAEIHGDPALLDEQQAAALGVHRLPVSLDAAVDAFEKSPLLAQTYGEALSGAIIAVRRAEADRVRELTPAELASTYRWVF